MFTKKHFINIISVLLLLAVNIAFLFEHSSAGATSFQVILWLYILLFFVLIWFPDKILKSGEKIIRKYFRLFFLIVVLMFIAFELFFNVNNGNAYFASFGWLTNLVNGIFPYNNSYQFNFPFLYYMDAPFYLLGNIGVFGLFGLALFFVLIMKYSSTNKEIVIRTVALLLLPAVYYEIVSGGDVFTNAVLIISIIFFMENFIDENKFDIKFFFLSVVFGALLCTRLIVAIPFLLSVLYFFRYNIKNLLLFILISLLISFTLIVPFLRWNYTSFTMYGPFSNSLASLSIWIYILLFVIVVYAGWLISDLQELLFASGVILFLISFIMFLKNGNYFEEMILSVPFLILSIKEYEVDKFLGKKIPIKEDH